MRETVTEAPSAIGEKEKRAFADALNALLCDLRRPSDADALSTLFSCRLF